MCETRIQPSRHPQQGMALLLVMIFIIGLAGLASLIMMRVVSENRAAENFLSLGCASAAADAGLEFAAEGLWGRYQASQAASVPSLAGYLNFLGGIVGEGRTADLVGTSALPESSTILKNGAEIVSVVVSRKDEPSETLLTVRSTGRHGGRERVAVQLFRISGERFQGFDYAMLANNINCVLCHAQFDNVERLNNSDKEKFGTFDRVKIGSLESLQVRLDEAESSVAGTLYTRGELLGKSDKGDYQPVDDLSKSSMWAYEIDDQGKIVEDKKGKRKETPLEAAEEDEDGLYLPLQYLYPDYPNEPEKMTDGVLPQSFPPVIPDENGNRIVDDSEWIPADLGEVTGGVVYGLPAGDPYVGDSLPGTSNGASTHLESSGYYDGNLVLVGTESAPIKMDGKVAVNGDIIITGLVEGTGQLLARHNIYFAGDTVYADGSEFGEAADGTPNLMAYAAGGSILVGDYLTPQAYNAYDYEDEKGKGKGKDKGKAKDQKYEAVRYDDSKKGYPSYLSKETIDQSPPLDEGDYTSFTSSEMMLFNRAEFEKAQADPAYRPRYYQLREGDRTYRFTHDTVEHANEYESWLMSVMTEDELAGATVLSMTPQDAWVSDMQLKQFWYDDEQSRSKNSAERFRIDGLLYTNNAIIANAHSHDKHRSRVNGTLEVRGAVVAADLGILAPGDKRSKKDERGFLLYYDARVRDFLAIEDASALELVRNVRLYEYEK